jgi:hypothetical protein
MSLKLVHLFVIALSVVLAVGSGLWAWSAYGASGSETYLAAALLAFAASAGLVVYAVRFWQKAERIGL